MFTPTLDWSSEWLTSLWWIAKGWAIAAVATMVILVLIGRFTTWGRQFWRVTGAYFTGRVEHQGLGLAGGAAAVGDHRRAIDGAVQLLRQRHADQLPGDRRRPRRVATRRSRNPARHGFWLSIMVFCRLGHHLRRAGHAGPVPDAAVHPARGAPGSPIGSPATGSTARRTTAPASSTTRSTTPISASSTTSTSSPPASDRRPTPRTTPPARPCCSARSTPIASMISFTAILWNLSGTADAVRRHAAEGDVLDRPGATWCSRRSSRSGSASRSSGSRSTTRSTTPPSATRWCGCATPRRRSPSTAARSPSARDCGGASRRSSPTTSATSTG